MRNTLTCVYITSREHCAFGWFMESLHQQIKEGEKVDVVVIDSHFQNTEDFQTKKFDNIHVLHVLPKPTIWQGSSRITSVDWWAASNSRNTGIALCETEWVAFCDDRCVLAPGWLQAIRLAMDKEYAVCGAYEKRKGMQVQDGRITIEGEVIGKDGREPSGTRGCGPGWWFGCTGALPLEWCLQVNGWPEDYADGLSFEDVLFGHLLDNNNFPIWYDASMKIIEDRSPEFVGQTMRRTDKGVSPNDKSHKVLEIFRKLKTSGNSYDLRALRKSVLEGNPFPAPTASHVDWYDQQPIKDMV